MLLIVIGSNSFTVRSPLAYGSLRAPFGRLLPTSHGASAAALRPATRPKKVASPIESYNRAAERGEDPLFHKAPAHLRPLSVPPFAALDCCTANSFFGVFTLGGLAIRASAEVLSPEGDVIPGLFAAGRNTAGLCLEGRGYASGLSIGEATFFGRVAGRNAAALAPWDLA